MSCCSFVLRFMMKPHHDLTTRTIILVAFVSFSFCFVLFFHILYTLYIYSLLFLSNLLRNLLLFSFNRFITV